MLHNDKKSDSNSLVYLQNYPVEELWRLFVAGKYHKENKGWFDLKKKNSLSGCADAFAMTLANLSQPLTLDFIQDIHKIAARNLARVALYSAPEVVDNDSFIPGELRNKPTEIVGYHLSSKTRSGLTEILDKIENQKDFPRFHGAWLGFRAESDDRVGRFSEEEAQIEFKTAVYAGSIDSIRKSYDVRTNGGLSGILFCKAITRPLDYIAPRAGEVFQATLKKLIDGYHQQMSLCDDSNKLEAIAGFITDLYQLHPFKDGNTRTICFILLNFLLTQNGLPIATMENIEIFRGHSKNEVVQALNEAMCNTLKIIEGEKNLFGFNTSRSVSSHAKKIYLSEIDLLKEVIMARNPQNTYAEKIKSKVQNSENSVSEIDFECDSKKDNEKEVLPEGHPALFVRASFARIFDLFPTKSDSNPSPVASPTHRSSQRGR